MSCCIFSEAGRVHVGQILRLSSWNLCLPITATTPHLSFVGRFVGRRCYSEGSLQKNYANLKARYPGHILLFQKGSFYEMFDEDADLASTHLPLRKSALSGMVGFPTGPAAEKWITQFLNEGFTLAKAEQKDASGSRSSNLYTREVVRVYTPGTIFRENVNFPVYLQAVHQLPCGGYSVVQGDVGTDELGVYYFRTSSAVQEHVAYTSPAEILVEKPSFLKRGKSSPSDETVEILSRGIGGYCETDLGSFQKAVTGCPLQPPSLLHRFHRYFVSAVPKSRYKDQPIKLFAQLPLPLQMKHQQTLKMFSFYLDYTLHEEAKSAFDAATVTIRTNEPIQSVPPSPPMRDNAQSALDVPPHSNTNHDNAKANHTKSDTGHEANDGYVEDIALDTITVDAQRLRLDERTSTSLELFRPLMGSKGRKGGVLDQLDFTATGMGRRMLVKRLLAPSTSRQTISHRLNHVSIFASLPHLGKEVKGLLQTCSDVPSSTARLNSPSLALAYSALRALLRTIRIASQISLVILREPSFLKLDAAVVASMKGLLPFLSSPALMDYANKIEESFKVEVIEKPRHGRRALKSSVDESNDSQEENTPSSSSEDIDVEQGSFSQLKLQPGVCESYDEAIAAILNATEGINALKTKYLDVMNKYETFKNSSSERKLAIKYDDKTGYTIETLKPFMPLFLKEEIFIPVATRSKTNQAFTSKELLVLEKKVNSSKEDLERAKNKFLLECIGQLKAHAQPLQALGQALASLDVARALGHVAHQQNFCRPEFVAEEGVFEVTNGRHLVVERHLSASSFTPNDCSLTQKHVQIITGPNMGGKSTYLRMNALIAILAHMGSFVPAAKAKLSIFDAVYARIGSGDNLHENQSTFMVEMKECAAIVHEATQRSFVILDEVGRGTSHADGLPLAVSLIHYLHDRTRCKVLVATHYLQLPRSCEMLPGVEFKQLKVQCAQDEVHFCYKIVPGVATDSYGIVVAKMAGLPHEILQQAITMKLENGRHLIEGS